VAKIWSSLIGAVLLSGCAGAAPVSIDIASKPDLDEKNSSYVEQKLGDVGYYYLTLNYKFIEDAALYHRLNRLAARITKYSDRPNIQYRYLIIDSQYHNAFSLPDGYIVFTKAMIDALETDEKIQNVLAHEIAHITHKHGLAMYNQKFGKRGLSNILGYQVVSLSRYIGYNKAIELQADQTALRYLYRAGLNPESYLQTLETLPKFEKEDQKYYELQKELKEDKPVHNKLIELLKRSYPEDENRIVNCRNYLQTVISEEKIQYVPEDFKL